MTSHCPQQMGIHAVDPKGGDQAHGSRIEGCLSILIAEDDQNLGEALADFLRQQGHRVDLAVTGREALACLSARAYPLVITDLVMPEVDGLTVLRAARERDPATLVVVMTGYASIDSAIQATREGAYDYLRKPFKLQEIEIAVANAARLLSLKRENQRLLGKLQDLSARLEDLQQAQTSLGASVQTGRDRYLLPVTLSLSSAPEYQQQADLERLRHLYQESLLTDKEYQTLKERMLI